MPDEFADDDLPRRLRAILGAADVSELTRLSGGASRETWRFTADTQPLVLQRQRAGDERDMAVEIAAVRAAFEAGVPAARVVAASTDPTRLGAAFVVTTNVAGETTPRKILRDEQFTKARKMLPAQLADALVRIHAIDPAVIPGLAQTDQIEHYREALDTLGQPHPAFELALRWLDANRPATTVDKVVHGDFRLGNVVVDADGLRAVLDWELVHLGDPMEDLGWMCVKSWRFSSPKPAAGVGEYEELFEAYETAGGCGVDRAAVHWWEVLGTLKWGIMCIMQANAHLTGVTRSHELAAIGRRVCENEHDLFLALEGHW
ncbi:MAG TPA: phosphotransferase family protein [Ilumatobacteraceae bacterium]